MTNVPETPEELQKEMAEAIARMVNTMGEAVDVLADALAVTLNGCYQSLTDFIESLEPYQRFEMAHPKKKPRGSIRRNRRRRR